MRATERDKAGYRAPVGKRFYVATMVLLWALVTVIVLFPRPALCEDDTLTIGVFPRRNFTDTIKAFTPLADYLAEQLGRPVRLETTRDFASFWKGVRAQRYDLVHYNQYHYVQSHKELGYRVILQNEEFGRSTISGTIMVRTDSGVTSPADLRGKKVVFGGGKKAMMSYIVATYLLRQTGLKHGDYVEEFALNPPNALMAPYYGQAAAGGVGDVVVEFPGIREKIDTSQLTFLAISDPVAHLPWAVKQDLAPQTTRQIQAAMVRLKDSAEGREILNRAKLTGLAIATDADYDVHRHIILRVSGEKF